jgi:hypothetical protein
MGYSQAKAKCGCFSSPEADCNEALQPPLAGDKTLGIYSGRQLTQADIEAIRWVRSTYPSLTRNELAGTVCEIIDWVTPSGRAKIPQCLVCLSDLEAAGLIDLPELRVQKLPPRRTVTAIIEVERPEITACEGIGLSVAEPGDGHRKWRGYVDAYHPLGYRQAFGSRLSYFITSNQGILGCIQFSASAWALESRDKWIGWTTEDRKQRLHLIINNSRFLILPNVHVKNLASRALSRARRQVQLDWPDRFGYSPVLLETFVDSSMYRGTIYKASGWTLLGQSKGRGRMDRAHKNAATAKDIYVYPMCKDFAEVLCGRKPWEAYTGDEG